jgi:hypothetical protein
VLQLWEEDPVPIIIVLFEIEVLQIWQDCEGCRVCLWGTHAAPLDVQSVEARTGTQHICKVASLLKLQSGSGEVQLTQLREG